MGPLCPNLEAIEDYKALTLLKWGSVGVGHRHAPDTCQTLQLACPLIFFNYFLFPTWPHLMDTA